ncbi:MAG: helix-turn-helix domain-containing protein [Guyparkeria sp.]
MPPQPGWQELFDRPLPVVLPSGWSQAAIRFIDEAQATYWIDAIAHLKVNAQLFLLLARLLAWQLQEKPGDETGSYGLVSAAETLIHQRACEGITVAEVAAMLGVSRSTLTQRFIELRGYGPGKAIVRRRIELACYLLENAVERSIEEIARESGFSAGSVLRRVFARELGLSPTRWHRRAQGVTATDRDGEGQ